MSKYTREISVRGELYKRLQQHAAAAGTPVSRVVESLVLSALNDGWTPSGVPANAVKPPRRVLRDRIKVEVSLGLFGLFELVDDQVVRARELAGQQLTHEALFENALRQALAAEGA